VRPVAVEPVRDDAKGVITVLEPLQPDNHDDEVGANSPGRPPATDVAIISLSG
jgi:hypothetical protein